MAKVEFPMVDVVQIDAVEGYKLRVRFSDGSEGVHNFESMVREGGPMVEPLKVPDFFARVFVESGVPTWPNGFDIDAINLYINMKAAGELRVPAAAH